MSTEKVTYNMTPEMRQARNHSIVEMYRRGMSLQSIGNYHGISRECARYVLKKLGIQMRQRGRPLGSTNSPEDAIVEIRPVEPQEMDAFASRR